MQGPNYSTYCIAMKYMKPEGDQPQEFLFMLGHEADLQHRRNGFCLCRHTTAHPRLQVLKSLYELNTHIPRNGSLLGIIGTAGTTAASLNCGSRASSFGIWGSAVAIMVDMIDC